MGECRVSIITVCRQSADTLGDTLASVLTQDWPDVEHIVVDGSPDDSCSRVIAGYMPRYGGRLNYLHERDGGIYDAVNKGIMLATGEIVATLNSDDRYTAPDIVRRLAGPIAEGRAEASYGDVYYYSMRGGREHVTRRYSSRCFRRRLMLLGVMPAHPAFFCARSLYRRFGMYDTSMRVAADFDMLLRMLYVGRVHAEYVPVEAVAMRAGGVSNSGWGSHLAIMRDHAASYRKNGVRSNRVLDALRYPFKLAEFRF